MTPDIEIMHFKLPNMCAVNGTVHIHVNGKALPYSKSQWLQINRIDLQKIFVVLFISFYILIGNSLKPHLKSKQTWTSEHFKNW